MSNKETINALFFIAYYLTGGALCASLIIYGLSALLIDLCMFVLGSISKSSGWHMYNEHSLLMFSYH